MAKVRYPTTFSQAFGVSEGKLAELGVLDSTLAIDTKLFIDPLLLQYSAQPEMHGAAVQQYRHHFETVIGFLVHTKLPEDVACRSARRLLQFHEIRGTCLGYGAASISGSGFGVELTERILRVGKEIVDLGIRDPDLFPAMALFEADIGPDRISDMATNVACDALIAFNRRILDQLGLKGEEFLIGGKTGRFLQNPRQRRRTPVILVPKDVLRKLPIANDWDDVATAAAQTQAVRDRVNKHIGHIWEAKAKRDKAELRAQALANREAFQTLLDVIHGVPPRAYSVDTDPDGLLVWAHLAQRYARDFPLKLPALPRPLTLDAVHELVTKIVARFQQLIEHNGLNKDLYAPGGQPRHESTAQRLFFAVAYCYCEASNVDISPEVDSGSGQIDFKFSQGFSSRVLVEVKLSTNTHLLSGYENQLETYKAAEQTMRAIYLVLDVGHMGDKDTKLLQLRNAAAARQLPLSDLVFIDAQIQPSASRRRGRATSRPRR